ncbi:hypothetical protein JCM6882_006763 [Rhodosporidiobolus microsporus]
MDNSGSDSSKGPSTFTVHCRDASFTLSQSQFETDSPNYFTACFLSPSSSFAESSSRTVHTDRNPLLFALIVEHLSGYDILPLNKEALPKTMSEETARTNLLKDAEYFQLDGLCEKLRGKVREVSTLTEEDCSVLDRVMDGQGRVVKLLDLPRAVASSLSRVLEESRDAFWVEPYLVKHHHVCISSHYGSSRMQIELNPNSDVCTQVRQKLDAVGQACEPPRQTELSWSCEANSLSKISIDGTVYLTEQVCWNPYTHALSNDPGWRASRPTHLLADAIYLKAEVSADRHSISVSFKYRFAVCRSQMQLLKDDALPPYQPS